ncbi:sodium:solute symporter family protein [Nigerium massiliense]|uniref:sodium:solute symporter family protein n=1 Tax=Nigerium massiliense TaxID=1522317 RepID=UPI00058FDF38|nr:sodium:solute symporter family protein [Nigerium massiliense]
MNTLDWIVVGLFFALMVGIGFYSKRKSSDSADFFVGGGKVPWWLSGVSHHVSGHSGVVFVAYAAIAYNMGFTIYVWWAFVIGMATIIGAFWLAPRWPRLRQKLGIQSPTEYLKTRYGLPSQQVIAWLGVLMKLLDIGAKWASIGILVNGFSGGAVPVLWGIILAGLVSMIYITIGGLWADLLTDFVQFAVQLLAGIFIAVGVGFALGERGLNYVTMWGALDRVQPNFSAPFNGDYTMLWCLLYLFVKTFEYNGGNWNLAARFIATSNGREARKAELLSSALYFVWPLLIFAPMWAGRLIFPGMDKPDANLYPTLTMTYLPHGLVGLVLAAMFAATMGMTVSDINALAAVTQRDILPVLSRKWRAMIDSGRESLMWARIITVTFTVVTMIVGANNAAFGGVIGLVLTWFNALVGVTGGPLILGLFKRFRHTDGTWTLISIAGGVVAFAITQLFPKAPLMSDIRTGLPLLVTCLLFIIGNYVNKSAGKAVPPAVDDMLDHVDAPDAPEPAPATLKG